MFHFEIPTYAFYAGRFHIPNLGVKLRGSHLYHRKLIRPALHLTTFAA